MLLRCCHLLAGGLLGRQRLARSMRTARTGNR